MDSKWRCSFKTRGVSPCPRRLTLNKQRRQMHAILWRESATCEINSAFSGNRGSSRSVVYVTTCAAEQRTIMLRQCCSLQCVVGASRGAPARAPLRKTGGSILKKGWHSAPPSSCHREHNSVQSDIYYN